MPPRRPARHASMAAATSSPPHLALDLLGNPAAVVVAYPATDRGEVGLFQPPLLTGQLGQHHQQAWEVGQLHRLGEQLTLVVRHRRVPSTRCSSVPVPNPPPQHMVTNASSLSDRSSSSIALVTRMQP